MPQVTTIRVDGLQELGARMKKLSEKVANKTAGRCTGAGAQIVKKAAKNNIKSSPSVVTGSLLDAVIAKKIPKSKTRLTSEHIVTVRQRKTGRKTKTKQQTAPHAHFIEYGTVNMPAEPFLKPALERNVQQVIEAMKKKLGDDITKQENL